MHSRDDRIEREIDVPSVSYRRDARRGEDDLQSGGHPTVPAPESVMIREHVIAFRMLRNSDCALATTNPRTREKDGCRFRFRSEVSNETETGLTLNDHKALNLQEASVSF